MYSGRLYLAVLCHKNSKKDFEYYEYAPSVVIKGYYYYFGQDELLDKYENVIKKIKQKVKLTETETLDMAFVCKFIPKQHAPKLIETIANVFEDAIIDDRVLKIDIGIIIGGMILKHIKDPIKQKKLLGI